MKPACMTDQEWEVWNRPFLIYVDRMYDNFDDRTLGISYSRPPKGNPCSYCVPAFRAEQLLAGTCDGSLGQAGRRMLPATPAEARRREQYRRYAAKRRAKVLV